MSNTIDLSKLALPFPAEDIEWRVSHAGMGNKGIYCRVLPYVTARAVHSRFDQVCGIDGWRNEEPRTLEINGKTCFACGMSVRLESGEWLTKWNVADPTNIEPSKGGWSGAEKRAGSELGVGRYLYYLDEVFADVSESPAEGSRNWNYAKLSEKQGGATYYWKTPSLPAWALPKDPEHEIELQDLNHLKRAWKEKFAPDTKSPKDLREGFDRFVALVAGEFPNSDYTCWTYDALERCHKRIGETTDPGGVSADVPFEG